MDSSSAGLLRNSDDCLFGLTAILHHQVGELVNDDDNRVHTIVHILSAGVVTLQIASASVCKHAVTALHLENRPLQGRGGLIGFGDHWNEQVRQTVVSR